MTKYIDADIWRRLPDDLPYKASVKRVLIGAPAADVVEVKRGHLIKVKDPVKEDVALDGACSVCGASNWDYTDGENFNYCPNCGAKWTEVNQNEL